jgi:hypothetical protein
LNPRPHRAQVDYKALVAAVDQMDAASFAALDLDSLISQYTKPAYR